MTLRAGHDNSYYLNEGSYASKDWTHIADAQDASMNRNPSDWDATTRGNAKANAKAHVQGLHDPQFNLPVLIDPDSTVYQALDEAHRDGTTVEILRVEGGLISTDGLNAQAMVAHVLEGEEGEPMDGLGVRNFVFKFARNDDTDGLEEGTTLSSAFVVTS